MTRQIIVWRHGRTDWNVRGRVQGQTDIPLDDTGRRQAAGAAARLASLNPTRILSSDLMRAYDTARALSGITDVEIETDHRLREMRFGIREGKTHAEALAEFPDEMRAWLAGEDTRMPEGETYSETADRFAEALAGVAEDLADDATAVVVSHGAAIRVGVCRFVGLPREHWRVLGGFNNCSWAVLEEGRHGWRIVEWNAGQLPEPILSDES